MTVYLALHRSATLDEKLQLVGSISLFTTYGRGVDKNLQKLNSLVYIRFAYIHTKTFILSRAKVQQEKCTFKIKEDYLSTNGT